MDAGLEPIGYRALDSLRMEKGYRYFGTDLTMLDTPFEAGLGAFVRLEAGDFIGRDALVAAREAELATEHARANASDHARSPRRLRTVVIGGADYLPVYGGEAVRRGGEIIGRLRSVAFGATVMRTIGYVYGPATMAEGDRLEIDILGSRVPAVIAPDVLVDPLGTRVR
jgi:glycine cleavage system aminomethyltransferase T